MSGDRGSKRVVGKAFEGGKAAQTGEEKGRARAGAQSGASGEISPADRGKTMARQTAFDLIGRRQLAI
jgi:hypothetical protein